jgi:hypothetical protein
MARQSPTRRRQESSPCSFFTLFDIEAGSAAYCRIFDLILSDSFFGMRIERLDGLFAVSYFLSYNIALRLTAIKVIRY